MANMYMIQRFLWFLRLLYLWAILLVLANHGSAATLVLEQGLNGYAGTRDATLFEVPVNNSAGGFPNIFSSVTKEHLRRSLIKFDIPTTFPIGTTISSVDLTLHVDHSQPGTVLHRLHRVTRNWNEGNNPLTDPNTIGEGAPAQTGDATWNYAAYPTIAWTMAGGDFSATVSASAIVGIGGTSVIFSGSQLTVDVVAWRASPASNFGWILIGDESQLKNARRYYSSEGTSGFRPRLTITYTAPSGIDDWALLN
jgi:hypothetical protein